MGHPVSRACCPTSLPVAVLTVELMLVEEKCCEWLDIEKELWPGNCGGQSRNLQRKLAKTKEEVCEQILIFILHYCIT